MPAPAGRLAPDVLGSLLVERDIARLESAAERPDLDAVSAGALQGELLRRRGEHAAACLLLDQAVGARPEVRALHHASALAHAASGNRARARARWQALLALAPDDAIARFQIAVTHHDDGDLEAAARWYEAQAIHAPKMAGAWLNLGRVRRQLGDANGAMLAWDRAHALLPADARPLLLAAEVAGERADLPDALSRLTRAIPLAPADARPLYARAAHRSSLALHAEAVADLAAAVALDPSNAAGHSALLVELHHDESLRSPEAMLAAHLDWASRHAKPTAIPPVRSRRPRRSRLRVAYLSPRFGDAPLAALLLPVLEAHDRSRFEITAYATHAASGETASRVRRSVDQWCDLAADDDAAATRLRADAPDVLVDLAGHSPGNRLPLLARRVAPLQVSWLDYFDTTGVCAIDVLISDAAHTPAAHADRFRERLLLMPHARFVYRPPVPLGARGERRAWEPVTFGSFNRHAKITDDVIDTWSSILRAVPGARLVLRASAYRSAQTIAFIRDRWRARGVPLDRIAFEPFVSLEALHAAYDDVDVALDPFPFNGGVTTCDALAHGVPVVVLEGDRMVSRQGCALLRAANRPQWIARDRGEYVATAVRLADPRVLEAERATLAADFPRTPLCDAAAFTQSLERVYAAFADAPPGPGAPILVADRADPDAASL